MLSKKWLSLPTKMAREKIFRFKHFAVLNDRTAMKVGTDGVLLGAWCPVDGARRVLDVGTGCGVIALMVAQRNSEAVIDAIDIDRDAVDEAMVNFNRSPWSNRLTASNRDFNTMNAADRYDLIVSNPPFFTNGVLPTGDARTIARHSHALTYRQLIEGASQMLTHDGSLAFITPADAESDIIEAASFASMPIKRLTRVLSVEGGNPKRILWLLTSKCIPYCEDNITIAHKDGSFTQEYIQLTGSFYINM